MVIIIIGLVFPLVEALVVEAAFVRFEQQPRSLWSAIKF